jgi:putative ABC transport system ATP-binding protein
MNGLAVNVEHATKRYPGVVALDGVTLQLEPSSVTGITGPSGSGKSTLLHVVGAMDALDSGSIRVGDWNVSGLSRKEQVAYRRTIGFVFQRFHLLSALTVTDNVAAPLLPRKQPFDVEARARELVAAVGLAGRENALPSKLSGGQQQRVAIARALMSNPGLLLADEPTGNLDSRTGTEILELLLSLRDRTGMTILIATHDPVIASRCDRIVRLSDGRVVDETVVDGAITPDETLTRIGRLDPR